MYVDPYNEIDYIILAVLSKTLDEKHFKLGILGITHLTCFLLSALYCSMTNERP